MDTKIESLLEFFQSLYFIISVASLSNCLWVHGGLFHLFHHIGLFRVPKTPVHLELGKLVKTPVYEWDGCTGRKWNNGNELVQIIGWRWLDISWNWKGSLENNFEVTWMIYETTWWNWERNFLWSWDENGQCAWMSSLWAQSLYRIKITISVPPPSF